MGVAWFTPQSEYRPTEYLQHWVRFWFDDATIGLCMGCWQHRLMPDDEGEGIQVTLPDHERGWCFHPALGFTRRG